MYALFLSNLSPYFMNQSRSTLAGLLLYVTKVLNVSRQIRWIFVVQENLTIEFAFAASQYFVIRVANPPSSIQVSTLGDDECFVVDSDLVLSVFDFDCSFHFVGVCLFVDVNIQPFFESTTLVNKIIHFFSFTSYMTPSTMNRTA